MDFCHCPSSTGVFAMYMFPGPCRADCPDEGHLELETSHLVLAGGGPAVPCERADIQ
jgi:hypothetical protein